MKTKFKPFQAPLLCAVALGISGSFSLTATAADSAETACLPVGMAPAKTSQAIPWSQIGAKAGADYWIDDPFQTVRVAMKSKNI